MTSPVVTFRDGYTEESYLSDEYLDGAVDYAYGFQALMVVKKRTPVGMQSNMKIHKQKLVGQQAQMVIHKQKKTGQQAKMIAHAQTHKGFSADMVVGDSASPGMQGKFDVITEKTIGMQGKFLTHVRNHKGFQAFMHITEATKKTGMSAKFDTLRHALCESYLEEAYLVGDYMTTCMHAFLGMQARMIIKKSLHKGFQANMKIHKQKKIGQQALMIVKKERPYGFSAQLTQVARFGMSGTMVIYNNTQLRILSEFPSRGIPSLGGNNWSATNQASGDFLPRNLNTDVEEQVFRSASTSVDLICNTGIVQGTTIDTIAILNHNLTRDALVQVQGSNSAVFATIEVSFNMTVETERMFYVAPTFPTGIQNQNKYWRFVISDPTNPDGYVEIGIIIFGNAHIFSVHETFDNPLVKGFKHFKDQLKTEGFTATNNDRALRRFLKLQFRDMERINGNFRLVEEYIEFARTSLKCLVVPIPMYPSRYAVYSKLTQLPEFSVRNVSNVDDPDGRAEYVDFNLDWDESE